MPGLAKTTELMLGTATVMLGTQANLFDLTPVANSIGLVKNFSISSEPAYTELTQGVKNNLVHSVMTSNPVRASMEVFEYTAQNLDYSLGLDGASRVANTVTGTLSAASAGSDDQLVMQVGEGASYTVGDFVRVRVDTDDHVLIRKVTVITTDTLTVDKAINEVVPIDASVDVVNVISIGSKVDQPFLSAKIVGKLANDQPIAILIPKVRITRGFTMQFGTDDYGNLPLEFTVFDLTSTDALFADFGTESAKIFRL